MIKLLKHCSAFRPLFSKGSSWLAGRRAGDRHRRQPGCATRASAPLIAGASSCSPRPWGQQQSGTRQQHRQQNYPIKPPEYTFRGEEDFKKKKDGVAWQREGRSSCAAGRAGTRAGPLAPCIACILCRGLLVTARSRSPPLRLFLPITPSVAVCPNYTFSAASSCHYFGPQRSSKNFNKKKNIP